jgi:hypothetical protein
VADEDVALLDARRRFRRHAEADIAEVAHLATVLAAQADDSHVLLSCGLDRSHDIATVATRRDGKQNVPCPPVSAHFAREDLVVAIVVADCRQR